MNKSDIDHVLTELEGFKRKITTIKTNVNRLDNHGGFNIMNSGKIASIGYELNKFEIEINRLQTFIKSKTES